MAAAKPRPSKRRFLWWCLILILVFALFVALLTTREWTLTEPPPRVGREFEIKPLSSSITTRASISIQRLAAELDKQIPQQVDFKHKVKIDFKIGDTEVRFEGWVKKRVPLVVSAIPHGLKVLFHGHFKVKAKEKRLSLKAEAEGKFAASFDVSPRLRTDWGPEADIEPNFRWEGDPKLRILGATFSAKDLADPHARKLIRDLAKDLEKEVTKLNEIRKQAESAWRRLQEPIQLNENPRAWLAVQPLNFYFTGIQTDASAVHVPLGLTFDAETYLGEPPNVDPPGPLPNLILKAPPQDGFHIHLPVFLPYAALKAEAEKHLLGKALAVGGHKRTGEVTLHEIDLYPSHGKLVLAARFNGKSPGWSLPLKGWIFLSGRPELDPSSQQLRVTQFAFTPKTDRWIVNFTGWLVQESFRSQLEQALVLDISAQRDQVVAAANEALNREVAPGVHVLGQLNDLRLAELHLTGQALVVVLKASGQITAEVR